jgi:hypothetical protein
MFLQFRKMNGSGGVLRLHRALPLLPIERRTEFGSPGAAIANVIVQPPRAHHADVSQRTVRDQFCPIEIEVVTAALHAHLNDLLGVPFRFYKLDAFFRGVA